MQNNWQTCPPCVNSLVCNINDKCMIEEQKKLQAESDPLLNREALSNSVAEEQQEPKPEPRKLMFVPPPRKTHKMWECDKQTNEIREAEWEVVGEHGLKKLKYKKGHLYVEALNYTNAVRKFAAYMPPGGNA